MSAAPYSVRSSHGGTWGVFYEDSWGIGTTFHTPEAATAVADFLNAAVAADAPKFAPGDKVSYEDVANPYQEGTVIAVQTLPPSGHVEYVIEWDSGGTSMSDMQQSGWKSVPA